MTGRFTRFAWLPAGVAAATLLFASTFPVASETRLPDGEIARWSAGGDIRQAWYGSPTSRYRHAILGDAIEAGSLHVKDSRGETLVITLPQSQVFEDRTPRLADLDGDGRIEVITIRAFQSLGASVAVFGLRNGRLRELAASEPIGRANRWLNIAGIADYAGNGTRQIAYVETPHIGGTLYIAEWRAGRLVPIASLYGFSNHKIGAREQTLSVTGDFNGDGRLDLALPANDRSVVRFVTLDGGTLKEIGAMQLPSDVKHAASHQDPAYGCARFVLENARKAKACVSE